MNPKLRSSVSVIKINDSVLEFFKTNTRKQVRIRTENDSILNLVCGFDGSRSISEIANEADIDTEELNTLIIFLVSKGIVETRPLSELADYNKYRRVLNFLADYATDEQDVEKMWNSIRESTVMIIGLGAVGSWVAINLLQSGVKKFILIDSDCVDETNLHRQFSYRTRDIGNKKIDVLEKYMKCMEEVNIIKYDSFLDKDLLWQLPHHSTNLIINCADKPTVDMTSRWVGEYCMNKKIPHIVGGGYNLHLSLIGQTVIPHESACVRCFEKQLEEDNELNPARVKKLEVKNRKIGSFGPMCSLIASFVGMEAIKVLSAHIPPSNVNRRGEFDIYKMDITYKDFQQRADCEWCGKEQKY